jgi:DNA-directed RNA polymerase subunit beta'
MALHVPQPTFDTVFRDVFEAMMAHDVGKISLHEKIRVRIAHLRVREKSGEIRQEVGQQRDVRGRGDGRPYSMISAQGHTFHNLTTALAALAVISDCFEYAGSSETVGLLDRIKDLGFRYATLAGLSFGLTDLKIPAKKPEIIADTEKRVGKIHKNYDDGVLTERERYNQVIDAWTNARVAVTNEMIRGLREDTRMTARRT